MKSEGHKQILDSLYDVTPKFLGELEAWLGQEFFKKLNELQPFVGDNGLDFNQTNDHASDGSIASFFRAVLNGNVGLTAGVFFNNPVAYSFANAGADAGMEEVQTSNGPMAWVNSGNGGTDTAFSGPGVTLPHSGAVGQHWLNSGVGAQWMKNTDGFTLIENEGDGIALFSSGSDADNKAIRLILSGGGDLTLENLPVSPPSGVEKVWNNSGVLSIT